MNKITSIQNNLIKEALSLKTKKNILETGKCFVESEKIIKYLIENKFEIFALFIEESKLSKFNDFLNIPNIYIITENVAQKLSDTVTNSGIFAIVSLPIEKKLNEKENFIVLDSLQDPSNLGAILRNALAFGYSQIILLNSVYPFTPKVIRSSMGYVFNVNLIQMNLEDFTFLVKEKNLQLISANLNGTKLKHFKNNHNLTNYGVVIGNEGNGVSQEIQNICKHTVTIEMDNRVESLNASVSAGIILYTLQNL